MSVITFKDGDGAYLDWLYGHPKGYVLNRYRSGLSRSYLVLHASGCPKIGSYNRMAKPGGFTTRGYIKVCAENLDELHLYARDECGRPDGSFSGACTKCMPHLGRPVPPSSDAYISEVWRKRGANVLSAPRSAATSFFGDRSMSKKIVVAAAKVHQGSLVLYTTSMKVGDLITDGFYSVETLDPESADDNGYQRLLNKARAKKLADYVIRGQDNKDAFLPTSVFLATDKTIAFDEGSNTIEISVSDVGPFSVVDGQHRLEGLKMAAQKDARVLDFEVPVNIAINLPKIAQMCHFLIVNTTQKSVDKSVEQRIIARLSDALDVEDMPSLPRWIFNTVEKGEVEKAVRYADYLNECPESPWRGKIKMANSDSGEGSINQRSFVKAIVKYVLTANNPLATIVKDFEKEKKFS